MKSRKIKAVSRMILPAAVLYLLICGTSLKFNGAKEAAPVVLQFYMVGDAPRDLKLVTDKVNLLAKKELNVTVNFNYTAWSDYVTKYNLLLASGQPIDLIYTASWLDYAMLARSGAFMPLDKLLPRYAPALYQFIPKAYWDQVRVDHRIYTIPGTWKEYASDGLQYRKDLQRKFKLPVPDSIKNFEAYMDGIKKNMPGQTLSLECVFPGIQKFSFGAFELLAAYQHKWVYPSGPTYGLTAPYTAPSQLKPYWGTPEFVYDMKLLKKWADKGYWQRSALSTKMNVAAFNNGQAVVVMSGQNPPKYGGSVASVGATHPDWELGYVDYPSVDGVALLAHATQNGFAISSTCLNPQKALAFYQKLVMDKTYNQLTEYGIYGKHYIVKSGKYVSVGDPVKSGFPREGMNGWAWRNEKYMLYDKSYDIVKTIFAKMEKVAQAQPVYKGVNISDGFAEDYSSYQSERTALGMVMTQYLAPLEAGLVDNVDAAVKIFMEKAKAVGLDKIQEEYSKQWKAYCKINHYQ